MTEKEEMNSEQIAGEIAMYLSAVREPTIVFTRVFLVCVNNLTFEPVFFTSEEKLQECLKKIQKEIPEIKVMEWK